MNRSPSIALAGLLLAGLHCGCASYQVGSQSLYRPDMRTIYVPMFESDLYRQGYGEWLTEAVAKEISLRTPYRVVSTPAADSVLSGRIVNFQKSVLGENEFDEPRNLEGSMTVQITWTDREGRVLVQRFVSSAQPFVPEGGQSLVSANQQAIRDLARQIVSQLETTNW